MAVAGRRCGPHSTMETGLVCGRCETPVCRRCVVATIVGTRCRGCAPKIGGPGSEPDETLLGFELSEVVRAGVTATVAVVALMAIGFAYAEGNRDQLIIRTIVFGGWLVSLTLHEFAHSLVAYLGGDREIKERGFLTLNPLKFMDPVWSVVAPLVLVMLGGLPLVGGRTLIDGHALRSRWWDTAVSAAGPATNLGIACLIAAAFKYGVIPDGAWSAGFAFLAVLQVAAAAFNLIPMPPLDGYGTLDPHLDENTRLVARGVAPYGYFLLIGLFWFVPALSGHFWDFVYEFGYGLGLDHLDVLWGWEDARLWDGW